MCIFEYNFHPGDRVETRCRISMKGTVMGKVNNLIDLYQVLTDDGFIGNWREKDLYRLKEKSRCPCCEK